jgi:hypothetical protein
VSLAPHLPSASRQHWFGPGCLTAAAVVAAAEAIMAAIALPHLQGLDHSIDAGFVRAGVLPIGATFWRSPTETTTVFAGASVLMVAFAIALRRWRELPLFLALLVPSCAAFAAGISTLSPGTSADIPRSIDLAKQLGVDTDNAAAYVWYPGAQRAGGSRAIGVMHGNEQ